MRNIIRKTSYVPILFLLGTLNGYADPVVAPISPAEVPDSPPGSGRLKGYLAESALPDAKVFLPPPAAHSEPAVQAADEAAYQQSLKLRGTKRWQLAADDINIKDYPKALESFACAIGFTPSEVDTPNLVMLLRRTRGDAGLATRGAKDLYARLRPYTVYNMSTCDAIDEARLSTQGAYPSGHASTGWAWALVLAELIPTRATAILQRGYSFGQSRVVCGYHWQSDIDAGRMVGAATVAVLHTNPVFNAQLAAARKEIAQKFAAGFKPVPECAKE